ncbi:alanine--tRNA ligase isoform X2 [Physcomitrium patens]|uniref:alanine--tRNA ligase isoform X2 n=1 Tax=Physcomitrium patens TaxID=3218 RepID=UPI000D16C12B|nr:alanine--tRNA ligase-like isoform X2 [Physcomitrium patens]|eukprot:XP_024378680.1 alanine--tRNA ligase-like isoform X2 [Physcomitrella patens]
MKDSEEPCGQRYIKSLTSSQKSLQLTLNREVSALKNLLETAILPAAKKAEFRGRFSELQEGIKQAQKSAGAASLQLKLNEAVTSADVAVALCQEYCVLRIDDGLDANAVREAASLVIEKHKRNKVLICAFVPNSAAKQGLGALDWLQGSLVPINGTGNSDNDGLAQGEGSNVAGFDEAMAMAKAYAAKVFAK